LTNQPYPTRHLPPLSINLNEYAGRLRELASIPRCQRCEIPLARAMTDIARQGSPIRVRGEGG
jgi:hypothetical protein